jgi:hypothetical protein
MTYESFFQVSFDIARGGAKLQVVFLENGGKVKKG